MTLRWVTACGSPTVSACSLKFAPAPPRPLPLSLPRVGSGAVFGLPARFVRLTKWGKMEGNAHKDKCVSA